MSQLTEHDKSKPSRRWLRIIILFSLGVLVLLSVWWLWTPSYLELTVPVTPNPIGYFWWEEHRTILRYADEPGCLYVYRKVGSAYADRQGWPTLEAAMKYFHDWLTARGWVERDIFGAGDVIAPETVFLKHGDQFRVYTRAGDRWGRGPRVVVAIIPVPVVKGYTVSVTTANPSWLRQLNDEFDD